MKWIEFAESLLENSSVTIESLGKLITKSVLVGGGLKPSEADIIVFSVVHSDVTDLRMLEALKSLRKVDDSNAKKTVQETKEAIGKAADSKAKKCDGAVKVEAASQATPDKRKLPERELGKARQPEKVVENKDEELSVSLLKIQMGHIRKAWKHPSACWLRRLMLEKSNAREWSGLAKYCTPDQLTNHRVVLITNVKPGKLGDVMSEGLVCSHYFPVVDIAQPLAPTPNSTPEDKAPCSS